jgi:predicted metalloprotease
MQGYVQPEKFTHGTSEQRVRWFMMGLRSGDPALMDEAFATDQP